MSQEKRKVLIKAEHLQKYFPIKKSSIFQKRQEYVKANKDISLEIYEGETLGLVGESGCGKSTFGRTLIQLYEQTGGASLYYGESIEEMMPAYVRDVYRSIPKVFPKHAEDLQDLEEKEAALIGKEGEEYLDLSEDYRLARIEYEEKYSNLFRLAGALLLSDDLDKVRDLLLKKYTQGKEVSKYRAKYNHEQLRHEMQDDSDTKDLDEYKEKLEAAQVKLDEVNKEVEAYRSTLQDHPLFEEYEAQRDDGIDLSSLNKKEMRLLRKDLQIIFQDPYSSLDPRFTVGNIIGEGLIAHKLFDDPKSEEYTNYIIDIMEKTGLKKEYIHRYPHQFSGGQRQRIGIARALALQPKFIVADEAVSALDVSIQSQVINLLQDLKEENNLTYLFITHDLGVVRYISDRIGVMYFGNLVELAPAEEIFTNPQHPYTKRLLAAIPRMKEDQKEIEKLLSKETNDDFDFYAFETSGEADADWHEVSPDHFVACRLLNKEATEEALG